MYSNLNIHIFERHHPTSSRLLNFKVHIPNATRGNARQNCTKTTFRIINLVSLYYNIYRIYRNVQCMYVLYVEYIYLHMMIIKCRKKLLQLLVNLLQNC